MNVAIVGSGYVGLVAGACFADSGNDVWCVDIDEKKITRLKNGEIPIYEPGLTELVKENVASGRLHFTTSLRDAVHACEVIFIAVGTPQDEDGSADLTAVLAVARGIGKELNGYKVIVDKSTVPVGTAKKVRAAIAENAQHPFDVVSNPEFLKEGAAVDDFMKPDRVVIGADNESSLKVMKELYAPFVRSGNPILFMDVVSAEMTKYAANTMLALRISFMNEVANLCDKAGADVDKVRIGIGTDARIGMPFLYPGIGYGGSCFPKDVQAFIRTGEDLGSSMKISRAIEEVNKAQKQVLVTKIIEHFGENLSGKTFAVWGLAFKPKTDDTRDAPALVIINSLVERGAKVVAYDPEGMSTFKVRLGDLKGVSYVDSSMDAVNGADALVLCTEWGEFRTPQFAKLKKSLKGHVIFDGRNIFDPQSVTEHGFKYYGIGRTADISSKK
jgi:UDPglucose 6-dehydrogenase